MHEQHKYRPKNCCLNTTFENIDVNPSATLWNIARHTEYIFAASYVDDLNFKISLEGLSDDNYY